MTLTKKPERRPAPASWGLAAGDSPWEYAPAPEATDHITIAPEYGLFIGNEFAPLEAAQVVHRHQSGDRGAAGEGGARLEGGCRAGGGRRAARRIGPAGRSCRARERAKYLYRIARLLQERSREFAVVESMNSGKPIKESRDVDVPLAAAHFFYYAGWADKLEYAFPNRTPRSLGVAAQVIPWNFPLLMLAWKIAPALAAGNTVILKPASTTPLTAYLFADVVRQADLPPGVVNIITGPGEIGMELVTHPDVAKVAFTGSTAVGKMIARAVAGTGKKVTLELGGKAANIVFDDAPLDQAIEGIINGIYFNQGEVCCAGSRLFVQESVYEPLIDKLKARLGTLRVGDPLDKNTDVGAINSAGQLAKVQELVEIGDRRGRRDLPARLRAPDTRLLLPTDALHRRQPEPPHRAGGDLRPGPVRSSPSARRRRPSRRRTTPRTGSERRGVDGEGEPHLQDGRRHERRRGVGQHLQPLRPDQPVRRLQGVRLRPRGRHPRPGRLSRPVATGTADDRHLRVLHRGRDRSQAWQTGRRRHGERRRGAARAPRWRIPIGTPTTRTSCSCAGKAASGSRCAAARASSLPSEMSSSCPQASSIGRWPIDLR